MADPGDIRTPAQRLSMLVDGLGKGATAPTSRPDPVRPARQKSNGNIGSGLWKKMAPYFDMRALDQSLDYQGQRRPATHPLSRFFNPTDLDVRGNRFQRAWSDVLRSQISPLEARKAYRPESYKLTASEEGRLRGLQAAREQTYRNIFRDDSVRKAYVEYLKKTGKHLQLPGAVLAGMQAQREEEAMEHAEGYIQDQGMSAMDRAMDAVRKEYRKQRHIRSQKGRL